MQIDENIVEAHRQLTQYSCNRLPPFYIIYDLAPNAEYLAVSKKCDGTRKYDDVKRRVTEMTVTDILTYRVS
jgi:hypothetical protein